MDEQKTDKDKVILQFYRNYKLFMTRLSEIVTIKVKAMMNPEANRIEIQLKDMFSIN